MPTFSPSPCPDSRVSISCQGNSDSARVGSGAEMCRRVLARNRSKNSDNETGASRSDKVASIGHVHFLSAYSFWYHPILEIAGPAPASKRTCHKRRQYGPLSD